MNILPKSGVFRDEIVKDTDPKIIKIRENMSKR